MTESSAFDHVNVKIFAAGAETLDLARLVPVFHRWIQESVCEELLIDVADYRHVPSGPGVILVGHEANYSLDNGRNRLGLLYNRKAALPGRAREKITQVFRAALLACRRLEEDPELSPDLKFDAGEAEIVINDRLLAPNTDETFEKLKPELVLALNEIYGSSEVRVERLGEPRERLRVSVHTATPPRIS
jgi:hypothetical protein